MTKATRTIGVCFALTVIFGGPVAAESNQSTTDQTVDQAVEIVGGQVVGSCGWPTTVSTGGCTGTLIHAKAISTAQHCGTPSRVRFGESSLSGGRTVDVIGCVGTGSQDAQICELAEAVDLPVTPVLFGCEKDDYLKAGQPVMIVGFGDTSFGSGAGTKRWASQTIARVEAGRVIIGDPGDPTSPCSGDSGGPVFVQVSDGSWRVFGTVLGGTTGTPCNSAADFQRIDTVVANFESQRGLDITPCFDAQTGAWAPTAECGRFFNGDHSGAGEWTNWCTGTSASSLSSECGAPFGDVGGDPDAGVGTGDDAGTGTGGNGNGESSGGCSARGDGPVGGLLALLALLLVRRRSTPLQ